MATQKNTNSKPTKSNSKNGEYKARKISTSSLKKREVKTSNFSSSSSKAKKTKKMPVFLTTLLIIAIIFGAGGFFTFKLLTQNDEFTIIGDKQIALTVGDEYVEQGVKIVSFGKDKSSEVVIESTIDTSVAGKYYVKYTAKDYRFKGVVRYRYVTVEEA